MSDASEPLSNGPAAATILAAAIGAFVLGVLALAGDAFPAVAHSLNIVNRTGPLSGVTTAAIAIWLAIWFVLARRWTRSTVNLRRINLVSAALIVGGLLLTFPPFMDLLQGK
jgi:fluoride ion exporter CrcB/FEX